MAGELQALGILVLIQMAYGLIAAAAIGRTTGTNWLLSSRETLPDYRKGLAGRMERARNNGFEALAVFTPAVAIVAISGSSSATTVTAAWVFVAARIVYFGCYAGNLVPWRTLVWFVGWVAVVAMILDALLG